MICVAVMSPVPTCVFGRTQQVPFAAASRLLVMRISDLLDVHGEVLCAHRKSLIELRRYLDR
jgi:hypothetical protein